MVMPAQRLRNAMKSSPVKERTRLLAQLEAEFEAAERSIREEGLVTPEHLKRHTDALLHELAEEEERRNRSA